MNSNESSAQTSSAPVSRRNFIKSGLVGAGAFALGSSFPQILSRATDARRGAPNILFIICDQWRFPQHLRPEESAFLDARLPNYQWLYERSVKFFGHYGAAAACTPVRSTILTGLYTHQTGILNTYFDNGQKDQANTLNPGFLTWGKALRELGYQTVWWGKWHESPAIAADLAAAGLPANLESYGFDGGTFPPYLGPNGKPITIIGGPENGQPDLQAPIGNLNQGIELDAFIAGQFEKWFGGYNSDQGPFATAVSLINPHDIRNYPVDTLQDRLTARDHFIGSKPPNYEDLATLAKNKPSLQQAQYYTNNLSGGADTGWRNYQDYYYWLQAQVDIQIGKVLNALRSRPEISDNTIIIFTSDHGDHGGSHGLHEKALSVYEESIRLPLLVYDPTGNWTRAEEIPRPQLTSTVDLSPLFLTLATGGRTWLRDPRFNFLAKQVDWERLLHSPYGQGRDYIISTSDEFFGDEFDPSGTLAPADAPFHVIGVRTHDKKFATYNYWTVGSIALNYSARQENELYDHSTKDGRLELENLAGAQPALFAQLQHFIQNEILPHHLRRQLPEPYQAVHETAIQAYINGIQEPNSIEQG
jgi:arylsulfatase A-like enzyme